MVIKFVVKQIVTRLINRFLGDYVQQTGTDQMSFDSLEGAYAITIITIKLAGPFIPLESIKQPPPR